MEKGVLYVVATPLGNLEDITKRSEEILKNVDLVLAEDTRVTKKLLNHLKISKPLLRYDDYTPPSFYEKIKEMLKSGKSIALLTDAGTPNISDPGYKLVKFLRENGLKSIPLPGPSSLTAALSVSGINCRNFTFLGYPPHKKGRKNFFEEITKIKIRPVVLFESPHRLTKTLNDLKNIGVEKIVIAKELTKIYEEIWEGNIEESLIYFQGEKQKGEFVIIIP
jgi:16S rRNA (cytidine1402-2'-O)-methyltransferase